MPQVLPMTRVEAYLAYKAGVISEADLKPSLKTNFYSGLEHWLAYWCGLCDDYPVDENNDPKWYTEEEYYVAYLCGIAPDYPYNCYRRVGAYLRHIISLAWPEPERPLTREEYYLSLIESTYKSSGDPSSNITIDRTAQAPFGDLKIYGDSFQQTYTGKNLLPISLASPAGLTLSYDSATGAISVVGTPTAEWVAITVYSPISIAIGTTITASKEVDIISGSTLGTTVVRLRDSTNDSTDDINAGGAVPTKTMTKDITRTQIYQKFTVGNSYNYKIKVQIEVGSTDTAFEPYVGGIPAPNPDYPQDIQVVTGEQTVKVTGKNLFDKSDSTLVFNGYLAAGTITLTNNPSDRTVFIPCQPNTEYTIQKMFSSSGKNRFRIASFATLPTNGAVGTNLGGYSQTDADTHNTATYTTSADAKYLVVFCYTDDTDVSFSQMLDSIQIELGATASDYVPYQGAAYNIDLSKNLYSIADGTYTSNGVEAVVSNGVITVNRTSSSGNVSFIRVPLAASFTAKNGDTLVIEAGNDQAIGATNNEGAYMCLRLRTSGGSDDASTDCYLGAKNAILEKTMGEDKEYGVFVIRTDANLSPSNLVLRPKIYVNPIELVKIGDYQDYIWNDNGTWKKHETISKTTFDGSVDESWLISNTGTENWFYMVSGQIVPPDTDTLQVRCSQSVVAYVTNSNTAVGCWVLSSGQFRMRTSAAEDTIANWTTHLSNTPMQVYCIRGSASDIEITDSALVAQLDALLEGGSYDYQTNIVVSAADPNLPGLLQVQVAQGK